MNRLGNFRGILETAGGYGSRSTSTMSCQSVLGTVERNWLISRHAISASQIRVASSLQTTCRTDLFRLWDWTWAMLTQLGWLGQSFWTNDFPGTPWGKRFSIKGRFLTRGTIRDATAA